VPPRDAYDRPLRLRHRPGTTNSVIAYTPLDAEEPTVRLLPIPQLVAAGTVESLGRWRRLCTWPASMKPARARSICRGPRDATSPSANWPDANRRGPGTYGRRRKSWLCHGRVDRRGEILPWNAPAGVSKISPVTATRRYLEHLVATWEQAFPDAPAADQLIVLTVPASFDAAARDLTREAALAAGLPGSLLLLEERRRPSTLGWIRWATAGGGR